MITAIYCRVSTDTQEKEGTSLESQKQACLKLFPSSQVFIEAYSGLSLERPQLNNLRELIRSNAIDTLIIYALDRLARDPVHLLLLMDELDRHKVALKVVTETVDDSDIGKLITHVRGYAAKLEALKIRERTTRGKRMRALKGKLPGAAFLYGYVYNKPTGTRLINEYEARVITKIFNWLVNDSLSCREICRRLILEEIPTPHNNARWGRSTIARIVHNESYTGKTYYFKTIGNKETKRVPRLEAERIELPEVTPPIISKELYNQAQLQLLVNRTSGPTTRKNQYLLTGHLYCGKCGKRYHGIPSHNHRYYRCSSHSDMTVYCRNKIFRADKMEVSVWKELVKRASNIDDLISRAKKRAQGPDKIEHIQKEIDLRLERIAKHRENIERTIKLYTYMESADLKEGAVKVDKINRDIKVLEKEIALLEGQIKESGQFNIKVEQIREWYSQFIPNIKKANFEQKRRLLKYFNVKIILLDDNVEVIINTPKVSVT